MPKKSPLLEEPKEVIKPLYSTDEESYFSALKTRLELARNDRDTSRPEFDGMSYVEQYLENERLASTQIKPRLNKSDTDFQSGVIRQKIFAILAALGKKNLEAELVPYDNKGVPVPELGEAVTVVLRKTEELDNDEEKQGLRYYELLSQGTVFVEEIWKKTKKNVKKITSGFDSPDKAKWATQLSEYLSYPCRTVLDGRGVYLGDITQYFIDQQPYLFTVDIIPYATAEAIFGSWDRWDKVPQTLETIDSSGVVTKHWTLSSPQKGFVEVVKYQDKWANEFQIMLNGVMMLPVGYPLSAVQPDGEYTIAKQVLKVISPKFAYGKSLCMEMRTQTAVYDEMLKMAVLKTQKSYMPPKANMTGKVISQKALSAGVITAVDGGRLTDLDPTGSQGVNQSEYNMISLLSNQLDSLSVNKSFQGQESGAGTATENILIQEQSSLMVDLIVTACSQLEKQLGKLRCSLLNEHWFKPTGKTVRNGKPQDEYRTAMVDNYIPEKGEGKTMAMATTDLEGMVGEMMGKPISKVTSASMYGLEDRMAEVMGAPVRILILNPLDLTEMKYDWQVVVNPTDRRGSNQNKLMFRAEMNDAMSYFPDTLNRTYFQDRFADIWGENPSKAFSQPQMMPQMAGVAPQGALPQGAGIPQPSARQRIQSII